MMDILGALLVLAALLGIGWSVLRKALPQRSHTKRRGAPVSIEGSVVYLEGLLASVALSQIFVWFGFGSGWGADGLGAIFGIFVGVATRFTFLALPAELGFSMVGIIASLPALGSLLFSHATCFVLTPSLRQALALLLLMAFLAPIVIPLVHVKGKKLALRRGGIGVVRSYAALGLGWYAVIELMAFAATALGLSGMEAGGVAVVFSAILVAGALTPIKPQLVLPALAVGLGVIALLGDVIFGAAGEAAAECLGTDVNSVTVTVSLVVSALTVFFLGRLGLGGAKW